MSDNAIEVSNITKIYKLYDKPLDRLYESLGLSKGKHKEFFALKNISFNIQKGETVGIIGTNGSGKSTILKIITGVLGATSGSTSVKGRISALLELGAGFNGEYTGIENIYLNGTMMGYTKEEIDTKLKDIVDFADIGDFVYQPVKSYSSGMFVRLAFAVAINIDPEILIVDEALSVGDVFFQSKCYKKFEEFKSQGKTVLLVTHDLGSVLRYCDKVILINQGEKVKEGQPKEIIDIYKKILAGLPIDENKETEKNKEVMSSRLIVNKEALEYGNGKATIHDYFIKDAKGNITNTIVKGELFQIGIIFEFIDDLPDPLLAFTIKDKKGNEITGTNTKLEQIYLKDLAVEKKYMITFNQKMDLQSGEYLLSFGCTGFEGGTLAVYHRLYDVTHISVISSKNSIGFYDMNSSVKLEKWKDDTYE